MTVITFKNKEVTANVIESNSESLHESEIVRVHQLVSEVIHLAPQAAVAKEVIAEYETKYKTLKDFADSPAHETHTFKTEDGDVTFAAASNKTEIVDMQYIFDKLGQETFLKLCTFPTAKLKDYLSKAELEQCTSTSRSGTRNLKSVVPNLG